MHRSFPPGPDGRPSIANLIELRRDPLIMFTRLAREYGDIAHFTIGPQHIFLLSHPDLIRDVLVTNQRNFVKGRGLEQAKRVLGNGLLTSEGELHLRQRRLIQPAFHRQRIANYAGTVVTCADRLSNRWQKGATCDIAAEMASLTLAVVGKTLFDTDVEDQADEIGAALTDLLQVFTIFTLPFANLLERLPLPSNRRFQRAHARLRATVERMIAERRVSGDQGDLLSMLLLAADEEGGMSDQQIFDEVMTLFLAGHETTANALAWTWYLLGQNPDVEARLHAELDQVLGGRLPTINDMERLPYTRMVMAESLRMYPPAWIIGRRAIADYQLRNYMVPAGSILLMSQWVMHHDARFFPDPQRFYPSRWAPEAQAGRPKFAYFPFGGGPRICVGEQFAWMEGILALAVIAQRWRMQLVPNHPIALQPSITLRPRYGMRMTLIPRIPSVAGAPIHARPLPANPVASAATQPSSAHPDRI